MRRAAHSSILAMSIGWAGIGCANVVDDAPRLRNLPTREAQQALVQGLTPPPSKKRFLRKLDPAKSADGVWRPAPQDADLRDAPEGRAWAAQRAIIRKNLEGSDWPAEPAPGKERLVVMDGDTETAWEIEVDFDELHAFGAEAMKRGIHHASERAPADPSATEKMPVPSIKPQGWSSGTDDRNVKFIGTTYPIDHRVLMSVGELNGGGCSGTLVGRRVVLTDAHCLVQPDGSIATHTFRPRRSGSQLPWGEPQSWFYLYPYEWDNNGCPIDRDFWLCDEWDWALLILPDDAWASSPNGTPGWLGYWNYDPSYIENNAVIYNDGYPALGMPGAPALWSWWPNTAWGQMAAATAIDFLFPHYGVPAFYRASFDQSGGQSGGPVWTDYPGPEGPFVVGMPVREFCYGGDMPCLTASNNYFYTHPNGHRGMTPEVTDLITYFRTYWP